jgi:hypothetical protein
MNTKLFKNLAVVLLCLGAFSILRAAENTMKSSHTDGVPSTPVPELASAKWTEIKDLSYDMRGAFTAGLQKLESTVDAQINELRAKRAAMNSLSDTKEWDFAMKEMRDSRDYLRAQVVDLNNATPETWDQQKEKVGQAWVRTQDAYDKVKSSTTS